ncbi:MAG: hypothetical protein MJ158_03420 [Alphaproteobacteria bacterium]|nr:hypothetical protein [Alphaproteobacteria bacterium]
MYEKTYYHINDIKIFEFQTMTCLKHFSCPRCVNRTQCRRYYKNRATCAVCRDILSSPNINLYANVDGVIDSQFFIDKNTCSIKSIADILKKYRRIQCQK